MAVRKAPPAAGKQPNQVWPALAGAAIALGLFVLGQVTPTGPPLWQSVVPPLLLVAVEVVVVRRRNVKTRREMDASEAVLNAGLTPLAVNLRPRWGGVPPKVVSRFAIHRSDDGQLLGYVTMVIEPKHFDPRDQLWLHGQPEEGAAVALQSGDERAPMLTARPFVTDATLEPIEVHPRSDTVNRLLGWEGPRPVPPVAATGRVVVAAEHRGLPEDLVGPARSARRRMAWSNSCALVGLVFLPVLAASLHLPLAASTALTLGYWGINVVWAKRFARTWFARPVAMALRQTEGLSAEDARFVAEALLLVRFGLPIDDAPGADPSAAPGSAGPATDGSIPAGWGYPPQ